MTDTRIEEIEAFWDRRPCNIRHSSQPTNTLAYSQEVALKKHRAEPHLPIFADFEKWKGCWVLELGCGIGTETLCFAKAGAHVVAIDMSSKSLEICRQRLLSEGVHSNVTLIEGNIEELDKLLTPILPLFDLVWSWGVLHHTPHPNKVLNQVKKWIHGKTELRIMVYSRWSFKLIENMHIHNQWDWSDTATDTLIQTYAEAQTGCPLARTYTFDEIQNDLLPEWRIQSIHKDHIFKWNVPSYLRQEWVVSDTFKNMSDERFRSLEKELGWHTLVCAFKKRQ